MFTSNLEKLLTNKIRSAGLTTKESKGMYKEGRRGRGESSSNPYLSDDTRKFVVSMIHPTSLQSSV